MIPAVLDKDGDSVKDQIGGKRYRFRMADKEAVMSTIEDINPDVIVHCAAWTAVDAAEDPEKRELVHKKMSKELKISRMRERVWSP